LLVAILAACGDEGPDPEPGLSHELEIQPIWEDHCVGEDGRCHGGTTMADCVVEGCWGIPRLDAGQAYERIVDHPAVQPSTATETLMNYVESGSPEDSYLFLKLRGEHLELGAGVQMPCVDIDPMTLECVPLADALSSADIDRIELWIREGAWE
jgi:hypothetical protein